MSSTSRGKVCRVCGADCTGQPRVRSRRGHYYCDPCFELERIKHPDDALLAELIDEQSSVVPVCPGCRTPMERDTIVCTSCGHSRAKVTGSATEPVIEFVRPPPPRDPVWHVRVGAVSTALGAGGTILGAAGAAGVAFGGVLPWAAAVPVAVLLLGLWLLSAGIGLTKRRVRAAVSIRRWATLTLVLTIVAVIPVMADIDATQSFLADQLGVGPIERATLVLMLVLAAAWSIAWPIVVLACMGRQVALDDVKAW